MVGDVGFVTFVGDITSEVEPRDTIGCTDELWVGNRAEGFADVRCIGYITVSSAHDGADTVCISGKTVICFSGLGSPGRYMLAVRSKKNTYKGIGFLDRQVAVAARKS